MIYDGLAEGADESGIAERLGAGANNQSKGRKHGREEQKNSIGHKAYKILVRFAVLLGGTVLISLAYKGMIQMGFFQVIQNEALHYIIYCLFELLLLGVYWHFLFVFSKKMPPSLPHRTGILLAFSRCFCPVLRRLLADLLPRRQSGFHVGVPHDRESYRHTADQHCAGKPCAVYDRLSRRYLCHHDAGAAHSEEPTQNEEAQRQIEMEILKNKKGAEKSPIRIRQQV